MKQVKNYYTPIISSIFLLLFGHGVWGQNAIIGSGFTAGWGGACNNNYQFEYFSASAGSSYLSTQNATGTGNQYFRLGIDWGGTVAQNTITVGSDEQVNTGTEYTLNSTCTTSGAMYIDVSSTSDNYIFKTKDAGSSPSRQFIYFRVQGAVQTVSSVTQSPTVASGVAPGQAVTVTANLSGALATGQNVYLRYSTDNFSTSTIATFLGSGSTYTATIPAGTNTAGAAVKYYVFTSGAAPSSANVDFYTINLNNLPEASYIIRIHNSKIDLTKKLIKTH